MKAYWNHALPYTASFRMLHPGSPPKICRELYLLQNISPVLHNPLGSQFLQIPANHSLSSTEDITTKTTMSYDVYMPKMHVYMPMLSNATTCVV